MILKHGLWEGYWMKELRIPKRLSEASGFPKSSIPFVSSSCLPCYLRLIDSFHARINVKLYLVWFFPFGRLQLNDLAYVAWGCRPLNPFWSPFSFQLSRENKPKWRRQAARSLDPTRVLCIVGRSWHRFDITKKGQQIERNVHEVISFVHHIMRKLSYIMTKQCL